MRTFLLLLSCYALVFVSCRHENTKPADKPVKKDSVLLTLMLDSNFTSGVLTSIDSNKYSYDDSGRLSGWIFRNRTVSSYSGQNNSITRDAKGRVTRVTTTYITFLVGDVQLNNHEIYADFIYPDASTDLPAYFYYYAQGQGQRDGDSVALKYSGRNIVDMRLVVISGATPPGSFSETTWTYDELGQWATQRTGTEDTASAVYYTYTFDGAVNPLKMGAEALISNGDETRITAGNILSMHHDWPAGHLSGDEIWVTTYRGDRRPIHGVNTSTDGYTRSVTYFYSDN